MKIKILFILLGMQGLIYGASIRQSSKIPNEEIEGEYEELPSAIGKEMPIEEDIAEFEKQNKFEADYVEDVAAE